jgi:hypothetical protein
LSKTLKLAILAATLAVSISASADATGLMTFEGPSSSIGLFQWSDDGMNFNANPEAVSIITPGNNCGFGLCNTDGSNIGAVTGSATLTRTDGWVFSLLSLDLGQTFNDFTLGMSTTKVKVTGLFMGGGTISTELTSPSDSLNYIDYTFGSDWSDLSQVVLTSGDGKYFSLDNIATFQPTPPNRGGDVPEPLSVSLLGTGMLGLAGILKRVSRATK